jgi:hypothetical protein
MKGNFEKARALLEEATETTMELGHRMDHLFNRALLGRVIVQQGKFLEARGIFVETAQEFLNDKNEGGVVFTLEGMASLYVALSKPEIAACLIGWADSTLGKLHDYRMLLEQTDVDKIIAACLAKMGEVAFSDAYEEGQAMRLDEAIEFAFKEN